MAKRKLTRIERIILISFLFSSVVMIGFWIMDKEPDRDFYLPEGFHGWAKVEYSVPGGSPIPLKEGRMQIVLSDSGYAATSTPLVVGWRRDRYFWVKSDGSTEQIPASVKLSNGETGIFLHGHAYFSRSYESLLSTLPVGTDTLLPDGTHLIKESADKVSYAKGKKTLEYFYISEKAESLLFNPPPKPVKDALESTEDRAIPQQ
ncbi:MAG: hypothetical protein SF052_25005 [Bacteroidia bacterium]|nr:hypothetical protein [Bacteroidia bacterium]